MLSADKVRPIRFAPAASRLGLARKGFGFSTCEVVRSDRDVNPSAPEDRREVERGGVLADVEPIDGAVRGAPGIAVADEFARLRSRIDQPHLGDATLGVGELERLLAQDPS